ncbi:hypothetical protein PVW48_01380 [Dinoroseobacter sp. PD6]|uniref:hypothetical protein n=1 Tax=Dinoroseobacter sp. PD6 TaxID=3028384 RepID=UPI00237BF6AC|nr:hypothetical protein [Dinoroseobacter sp. PD6]MDD9715381.1 hypothetical protein [Dinoroseobacter sp. PD6]
MRTGPALAVAALFGVAACDTATTSAPANIATDPRTQQVTVDGTDFLVLIDGEVATATSLATGTRDREAILRGARSAMQSQTDCAISELFKFPNIDRYQARLAC